MNKSETQIECLKNEKSLVEIALNNKIKEQKQANHELTQQQIKNYSQQAQEQINNPLDLLRQSEAF